MLCSYASQYATLVHTIECHSYNLNQFPIFTHFTKECVFFETVYIYH